MKGFTLVEFLIVISIISILAVTGVVVYMGITRDTGDAREKADLNAIAKAYEVKFTQSGNGVYQALENKDFSSGGIPKTPQGGDYSCLVGPSSNCTISATDKFAYCVPLGNQNTPCFASSENCYCKTSTQGETFTAAGGGGGGGAEGSSCDPYGILSLGLAGYWKMDEGSGQNVSDSTNNDNDGTLGNSASPDANDPAWQTSGCRSGTCLSFDGIPTPEEGDLVIIGNRSSLNLQNSDITYTAWINPTGTGGAYRTIIGNDSYRFTLGLSNSNRQPETWINSTGPYNGMSSITGGQWTHLAVTFKGNPPPAETGELKFYRNGQLDGIPVLNVPKPNNFSTQYLGSASSQYSRYGGLIDDARIYNRALPEEQINLLASGCISP